MTLTGQLAKNGGVFNLAAGKTLTIQGRALISGNQRDTGTIWWMAVTGRRLGPP